jgi:hypothetical protein
VVGVDSTVCDDANVSERPVHFVPTDEGHVVPTRFAQSHWGDDHLNGPAVVGLAAWTLEQAYGLPDFMPARLTVDLFMAARGVPTSMPVRLVRDGRRVRNSECDIVQNGIVVARATLVQYRRSAAPRGEEWSETGEFELPSDLDDSWLTCISSDGNGWTRSIADHQNTARKRAVNRTIDVVEGQPVTPFVRAAMAAEGTSLVTNLGTDGVGYINGDLTIALARLPQDDRIGVQADSHWTADGISVGSATLFDGTGAFGTGVVTAISNPDVQIDFTNDPFPSRTP